MTGVLLGLLACGLEGEPASGASAAGAAEEFGLGVMGAHAQ
jgi:hypothetical protein